MLEPVLCLNCLLVVDVRPRHHHRLFLKLHIASARNIFRNFALLVDDTLPVQRLDQMIFGLLLTLESSADLPLDILHAQLLKRHYIPRKVI